MAGPLAPSPRPTPLNYKKKIFFVDSLFAQITLLSIDTPVAWLLTIKCEKKNVFFYFIPICKYSTVWTEIPSSADFD